MHITDLYKSNLVNQKSYDFWSLTEDQKATSFVAMPGHAIADRVVFHNGQWCSVSFNSWSDIPHYRPISKPWLKNWPVYYKDESLKMYKSHLIFPEGGAQTEYVWASSKNEALESINKSYPHAHIRTNIHGQTCILVN